MSLPFLPLRTERTSGVLDDPNIVGSIVEQVAAGNAAEACRIAVRWCSLTKDRRAQCDGNQGLLWKQLTGAVFPTARAPTPADAAHGYRPKAAQSAAKEWFVYLCKQMTAMKERRQDYAYAKIERDEYDDKFYDDGEESDLEAWDRHREEWMNCERKLARLEEKVRAARHEYPQDADERRGTLDNRNLYKRLMDRGVASLSKAQLLVLATRMRFQMQQAHMAKLFPEQAFQTETDVPTAKANEAWSRLRADIDARLHKMVGPKWAARRESAQRFAVHRDRKDPREAELTALVRAAEARLDTTPRGATYAGLDRPEQAVLRGALNDLTHSRFVGWTLHAYRAELNRKKAALERALAPLLVQASPTPR